MRVLALAMMVPVMLAAAFPAGAGAAEPPANLTASRSAVVLVARDVTAAVRASEAHGFDRAEIDLGSAAVRARLFRNAGVVEDFASSRRRFGTAADSPYLAALGVGDGLSARVRAGRYSLTTAVLSAEAGNSVATELAALDGAVALQAGRRQTGRSSGSASFAGAHADFDLLNAEFSVRWHVGWEQDADGVRETSAGAVAAAVSSVIRDGDRLRAAVSRPIGPALGLDAPGLALRYMTPTGFGRLTCDGAVEPGARESTVRVSWAMAW